jgi:hypothetical protein
MKHTQKPPKKGLLRSRDFVRLFTEYRSSNLVGSLGVMSSRLVDPVY